MRESRTGLDSHGARTAVEAGAELSAAASSRLELIDAYIRQLLSACVFDRYGEQEMNDVNVAREKNDESMDACDVVELGEVSKETKGLPVGRFYDGFFGLWGS